MVQKKANDWDFRAKDPRIPPEGSDGRENAEYPFLHVHTEGHENIDPMTGYPVEIIKGYAQKSASLAQGKDWDFRAKDPRIPPEGSTGRENAEYPFVHVHTEGNENIDPITRYPVEIIKGYAQKSASLA